MLNNKRSYLSFMLGTAVVAVLGFIIISACTNEQAKAKPNLVHKAAPKPGVLAKIGDEEITDDTLIGEDKVDFFELKKREYELRMDRLNKLMVDKLIGAEAKKAGMETKDFITKKVTNGEIKISDKEFKKFLVDKHIKEEQVANNPMAKERINAYLQEQKKQDAIQNYLAKLTKSSPVEVYFEKPKMGLHVEPGAGPALGGEKAPVTIVEFSDFQCPFCARGADIVHEIEKKYKDKVRIVFRQFPLEMHKNARQAAEASMCVNEQGGGKFWKFHDLAFKNQNNLDLAGLEKFAKDVGADDKKYSECMSTKKYSSAVQSDMEYGEKVGVRSTPTFFVNGELVAGALPIDQFSEVIDEALQSKKE